MSDATIAYVGRKLAVMLRAFAKDRRDDLRKGIATLQTELCQALRDEEIERAMTDQIQSDVAQPWLPMPEK